VVWLGTAENEGRQTGLDRFGADSSGPLRETAKHAAGLKNVTKTLGGEGDYFGAEASLIDIPPPRNAVSDALQAVANSIRKKGQTIKIESADNVAKELASLSAAARSGDKNTMLLASKAAAQHLNTLTQALSSYASKIPGNNARERQAQDNLIRCANGLRNYATHLKILTAVKASSIHETMDTDESLTKLVTELGDIISSGMDTLIKSQDTKMIVV